MYKINLVGEKPKAELYNTNVAGSGYITKNGDIFYVKDTNDKSSIGNLYKNKELIDENVDFTSLVLGDSGESLFYIKNDLYQENINTLIYYKNGEFLPIASNVSEGNLYDGKYYYLTDFNKKTLKANLNVFVDEETKSLFYRNNNSNPKKISNNIFIYNIDENVDDIISPNLYFSGFRSNNKDQSH